MVTTTKYLKDESDILLKSVPLFTLPQQFAPGANLRS